jgi:hypothetical protein
MARRDPSGNGSSGGHHESAVAVVVATTCGLIIVGAFAYSTIGALRKRFMTSPNPDGRLSNILYDSDLDDDSQSRDALLGTV